MTIECHYMIASIENKDMCSTGVIAQCIGKIQSRSIVEGILLKHISVLWESFIIYYEGRYIGGGYGL